MTLKELGLLSLLEDNDGVILYSELLELVDDGKDSIKTAVNSLIDKGLIIFETTTHEGKYTGKQIRKSGFSAFPYILTSNYITNSSNKGKADFPQNRISMEKQEYQAKLRSLISRRFKPSWLRARASRANTDVDEFLNSFIEFAYGSRIEWADNKGNLAGIEKLIRLHSEFLRSKPVRPSWSDEKVQVDEILHFSDKSWQRASNSLERDLLEKGIAKGIFNKDQLIAFTFVASRLGAANYHQNWEKICGNNYQEWRRLYEGIPDYWRKMKIKPEIDETKL